MVQYEWCYEVVDEYGDIIESSFADKLSDLTGEGELVLVRNEGNEINGLEDRYWAYVKDGKLPECFSDAMGYSIAIKVPQRFHKELEKHLEKT